MGGIAATTVARTASPTKPSASRIQDAVMALTPLLPVLVPILGTVAGTMIGGLLTYAAGVRQKKIDLQLAERQAAVQISLARDQIDGQIAAERDRQRQQKIEEAYGFLMEWLYDLEGVLDEVWSGVCEREKGAETAKAMEILDEWSWKTLRPPRNTAATQFYWSPEVVDLIEKFRGVSSDFHSSARVALTYKESGSENIRRKQPVLEGRNRLLKIIQDLRDQVRGEMLSHLASVGALAPTGSDQAPLD